MGELDETNALLREMTALLRILARPQLTEMRERFHSVMLASEKRRQMWAEMDGSRSVADIARKVGASGEAVRQFLQDVEEKFPGIIETPRKNNAIWPKKVFKEI